MNKYTKLKCKNPRGCTKEEVIKYIGKKNWKKFSDFMVGQTVCGDEKGKILYYECDIENFLNKIKGKPYFFD